MHAEYEPVVVGDPRGVLDLKAGRRHNQRTRDWRIGHLITVLKDKAEAAGIGLTLVDERGTSSTCPACRSRIPKPAGRVLACPACQFTGHRDLSAAANIAARLGDGTTPAIPAGVTHRRAGAHLPGVAPSRRDPRRRAHHRGARGSPGRHRPARASPTRPPSAVGRMFGGSARHAREEAAARDAYQQECTRHAAAESDRRRQLAERRRAYDRQSAQAAEEIGRAHV